MPNNLEKYMSELNKSMKDEILVTGTGRIYVPRIPFSSPRANYMLYGGLPRGRMVEFAGEESGGKTTTALDVVAQAQKLFQIEWDEQVTTLEEEIKNTKKPTKDQNNRLAKLKDDGPLQVVFVDSENTFDEKWAIKIGVDVDNLYLLRPQTQTAEQVFDMMLDIIRTGNCGLMVMDSVAMLIPKAIYEENMEKKSYAGISQPLTMFTKRVIPLLRRTNTLLIMINQIREDLNNPYNVYNTPGGKAFRHNCSVRLFFQRGTFLDLKGNELKQSAETPAGHRVMIALVKTKVFKPNRRSGFYTLKYDTGIDAVWDTMEVALKEGYIIANGSWYNFLDVETGELLTDDVGEVIKLQGKPAVAEYLCENDFILEELSAHLNNYDSADAHPPEDEEVQESDE